MLGGIAAPISLLGTYAAQGNYHLALAPLILKSKVYRDFYLAESERGVLIGVDNGVVEQGESLSLESVIEAARAVNARELVLSDMLGDGVASYEATREGLVHYNELGRPGGFELMAVPHGSSTREWFECYLAILRLPVDVVGISMFDSDLFEGGRVELLGMLEDLELINFSMAYHMLGCWADLREAYGLATRCRSHAYSYSWYVEPRSYVRSMDTGLPVRWGLQGLRSPTLQDPTAPPKAAHRRTDFFAPVEPSADIQWNVDLYKALCAGGGACE